MGCLARPVGQQPPTTKVNFTSSGLPAVVVTRPGKWGNPYIVGKPELVHCGPMTAREAVFWFEADLDPLVSKSAEAIRAEIVSDLRGKNLACWCRLDQPCHADVLLKLAEVI